MSGKPLHASEIAAAVDTETGQNEEKRIDKTRRPGVTIGIIGGVVGAIVVGGFVADHDNDPKPRSPHAVTSDILPTELRAPQLPSSEATKPATTKSPEVTYPQAKSVPTDIPALGALCVSSRATPAKTVKAENGSLFVQTDIGCLGGDPKKESAVGIPGYRNPSDIHSQTLTVEVGDIANLLCVEKGPLVNASDGNSSAIWAQADIYEGADGNISYKGRAFISDVVTGFAASDPMNGEFIPECGKNAKKYFP